MTGPRICQECGEDRLYGVHVQGEALGPLFYVCSSCHFAMVRRFTHHRLVLASASYTQTWNAIQANLG